jgi:hypothetical protein
LARFHFVIFCYPVIILRIYLLINDQGLIPCLLLMVDSSYCQNTLIFESERKKGKHSLALNEPFINISILFVVELRIN